MYGHYLLFDSGLASGNALNPFFWLGLLHAVHTVDKALLLEVYLANRSRFGVIVSSALLGKRLFWLNDQFCRESWLELLDGDDRVGAERGLILFTVFFDEAGD